MACLRWLDANGEAEDSAADQLLSRLNYEDMGSSVLLAAARGHEGFRGWRGALPALASAALAHKISAELTRPNAVAWRKALHEQLRADLRVAGDGNDSLWTSGATSPPLELQLAVPLPWLQQEAAALEHRTHRLQAQPASQKEIETVQRQLVSWYRGKARVYGGHRWLPSLALFLRIRRPSLPFQFGALNLDDSAAVPDATAQRQVRLEELHLSAMLCVEAQALPPLAPRPASGGASSAGTPGPLVEVEFATIARRRVMSREVAPKPGPFLVGAYGSDCGGLAGAAPPAFLGLWHPPSPAGSASCLVSLLEGRFSLRRNAGAQPLHELPDLTTFLEGEELHFSFTIKSH